MIDFLRANPFVTRDEYMWKWTMPQIRIAARDFTHIRYLTEKQAEARKHKPSKEIYDDPNSFVNDLGFAML